MKSAWRPYARYLAPGARPMLRAKERGGIGSRMAQSEESQRSVLGSRVGRCLEPLKDLGANSHTGFYAARRPNDTVAGSVLLDV